MAGAATVKPSFKLCENGSLNRRADAKAMDRHKHNPIAVAASVVGVPIKFNS